MNDNVMSIDRIHFCVTDADRCGDWLLSQLGLEVPIDPLDQVHPNHQISGHTSVHLVGNARICFSMPTEIDSISPVAQYLNLHPSGVKDIDFRVGDLDQFRRKLDRLGIKIIANSSPQADVPWLKIQGWGSINHTIIAGTELGELKPITEIDHLVLNVAAGELVSAVDWYQQVFDFRVHQTFDIHTSSSGLFSQALISACGQIRFNINEPSSPNSQIQSFLDANRGAGIQHLALHTHNIFQTVDRLRQGGVEFLPIPPTYYTDLEMRSQGRIKSLLTVAEWRSLQKLQILADCSDAAPDALLLQIFTKPIFSQPTFFFEIIERRNCTQGFGAGNFQALFAAVEQYSDAQN